MNIISRVKSGFCFHPTRSQSLWGSFRQMGTMKVGKSVLTVTFFFFLTCSCISAPLTFCSSAQNNLFLYTSHWLSHSAKKQGLDSKESIELLLQNESLGFCTVQQLVFFSFRPLSYQARIKVFLINNNNLIQGLELVSRQFAEYFKIIISFDLY